MIKPKFLDNPKTDNYIKFKDLVLSKSFPWFRVETIQGKVMVDDKICYVPPTPYITESDLPPDCAILKLDENFVFDPDEMVGDENSDSRKVFNAMVNKIVDKKANQIVGNLDAEAAKDAHNAKLDAQAQAFIQKNGLTKQEFMNFVQEAQHKFSTQGMSFDDMWLIVNKNKAANNIANSTKQDMLNQMKGVRNIPTSQSSSNNAGKPNNVNDDVFDALLGSDGNIEELLG